MRQWPPSNPNRWRAPRRFFYFLLRNVRRRRPRRGRAAGAARSPRSTRNSRRGSRAGALVPAHAEEGSWWRRPCASTPRRGRRGSTASRGCSGAASTRRTSGTTPARSRAATASASTVRFVNAISKLISFGKQRHIGTYVTEEQAARAHDLAAIKYWGTGPNTKLNFNISDYEKEIEVMNTMYQDEYVAYIRRQSSCFSSGTSSYQGVTRRKDGKWQARLCRIGESRDTKARPWNIRN